MTDSKKESPNRGSIRTAKQRASAKVLLSQATNMAASRQAKHTVGNGDFSLYLVIFEYLKSIGVQIADMATEFEKHGLAGLRDNGDIQNLKRRREWPKDWGDNERQQFAESFKVLFDRSAKDGKLDEVGEVLNRKAFPGGDIDWPTLVRSEFGRCFSAVYKPAPDILTKFKKDIAGLWYLVRMDTRTGEQSAESGLLWNVSLMNFVDFETARENFSQYKSNMPLFNYYYSGQHLSVRQKQRDTLKFEGCGVVNGDEIYCIGVSHIGKKTTMLNLKWPSLAHEHAQPVIMDGFIMGPNKSGKTVVAPCIAFHIPSTEDARLARAKTRARTNPRGALDEDTLGAVSRAFENAKAQALECIGVVPQSELIERLKKLDLEEAEVADRLNEMAKRD